MSDVHGRKREKTTEELVNARKEREAVKIKEYNGLVEQLRIKMDEKSYDNEAFSLTTKIVQWNPDYYTIWNYRRIILLEFILKEAEDKSQEQKAFVNELLLFLQLIKINPKSYWLWNHRIWCLEHMPDPDWKAELGLVERMLSIDARNFHGWNYRRYVVNHLRALAKDKTKVANIAQQEYEFTTKKINQSFSNYSAWHQRSKLLPEIVENMSEEEKNKVATDELEIVQNAIYTDPEDQSAWLYYWWLIGKAVEEIIFQGAYRLNDTHLIFFSFNGNIKLLEHPQFLGKNNEPVSGKLYPFKSDDGELASIWVFAPSDIESRCEKILVSSKTVLPNTSARAVPLDVVWEQNVEQISRGPGAVERVNHISNELESSECDWNPSESKMYMDPTSNDQAAWFTLDKVQLLKNEIQVVRELLEIEPDSAWALQTLVHFLTQLQLRSNDVDVAAICTEILQTLDRLVEIDSDRRHRYEDLKNRVLIDQKLSIKESINNLDLTLLISPNTPLLSKLLLVSNITVASEELQIQLNGLPFLEECHLK